ncbi:MAG: glutaredoxin family protein, partial [Pseudomonas gingeri]
MLTGMLKKVLLILLVVVVYQNWGKIERVFNPGQMVSEQTRAKA